MPDRLVTHDRARFSLSHHNNNHNNNLCRELMVDHFEHHFPIDGDNHADAASTHSQDDKYHEAYHPNGHQVREHLRALHGEEAFTVHGPVVTLNDAEGTVVIKKKLVLPIEALEGEGDETDPEARERAALAKQKAIEEAAQETVLDVWVGHYSPKTYKATAEVVVADPPTGTSSGPLFNAKAAFNRLVVMERGEVS